MVEVHRKRINEVLALVGEASTKKDKITILQQHSSDVLKNVLKGTFDDAIVWNLPEGDPPYQPSDEHNAPSSLSRQLNQLVYFVKGVQKGSNLTPLRREMMFIRLLEALPPSEATVVLNMVAKRSPAKGLTKTIVKEAFPGLISK